ncbi:MAG: hypothetical protein LBC65_05145, partial [Oscillospiraceae bacterium]|nr:hypothetical protein [Oscillospiraceae bacterium]
MRIVKMRRCMAALLIAAIALSFGWIPSVVANADYAGGYSPGVTPGKVTFVMYPHAKASAGDQTPEMVAQLDIGSDGHIVGLIATKTAYLNVWASYNVQGYELSGWIDMATNQFVNLSLDTFPAEGVVLAAMFETQTVTYYSADFAAYSADKTAAAAPNFSTSYDVWTVLDKNSSIDPADWIYTRKEEIPVYNYWMMPERTVPDAIIDDQGNSIASFQGWALSESDANAGTLFSVGADGRTVVGTGVANGGNLKLYASYRSVTFYAPDGGGNTVLYKTPRALDGQNIPNPGAAPSAGGAKFTGWFTEGGAKYSFGQSLTD